MAVPDDAKEVLAAIRLGWYLAEVRGRNWPQGPPGAEAPMPPNADHSLPLRFQRSRVELRIEAQAVLTELAKTFSSTCCAELDDAGKELFHAGAGRAAWALRDALAQGDVAQIQTIVAGAVHRETGAAAKQRERAEQAGAAAAAASEGDPETAPLHARAEAENRDANADAHALEVLEVALTRVQTAAGPSHALEAARAAVHEALGALWEAAKEPWARMSNLLWKLDADIQDQLAADSEIRACGYQLGRGLAETYWTLDLTPRPANQDEAENTHAWGFVFSDERCAELTRMLGRLSAYMSPYSAAAIAGSIKVWQTVAISGVRDRAGSDLYLQTRRWYELVILGQDPTTLIQPGALLPQEGLGSAARTVWRQARELLGAGQAAILAVSAASLLGLAILIGLGNDLTWAKPVLAVLTAAGVSITGVSAKLRNSAQAILKRLQQDAYTDLIAIAITVAPDIGDTSGQQVARVAVRDRTLTPATPH